MQAPRLDPRVKGRDEFELTVLLQNYGSLLAADIASMKKIRQSSRKRPNRNFAIAAAPAAIPVNPNSAAIIAMTRKIIAQRSMSSTPKVNRQNLRCRVVI